MWVWNLQEERSRICNNEVQAAGQGSKQSRHHRFHSRNCKNGFVFYVIDLENTCPLVSGLSSLWIFMCLQWSDQYLLVSLKKKKKDFWFLVVGKPVRVLGSTSYCTHLLYSSVLSIARVSRWSEHSASQKSGFFDFGGGHFLNTGNRDSLETRGSARIFGFPKKSPTLKCHIFFSTEPISIIFNFLKSTISNSFISGVL